MVFLKYFLRLKVLSDLHEGVALVTAVPVQAAVASMKMYIFPWVLAASSQIVAVHCTINGWRATESSKIHNGDSTLFCKLTDPNKCTHFPETDGQNRRLLGTDYLDFDKICEIALVQIQYQIKTLMPERNLSNLSTSSCIKMCISQWLTFISYLINCIILHFTF